MMIRDRIKLAIEHAILDAVEKQYVVWLEYPNDPTHGDYATNVALQLGKELKRPPLEIAQEIVDALTKLESGSELIEKAQAVAPGFINIFVSQAALIDAARQAAQAGDQFGSRTELAEQQAQQASPRQSNHVPVLVLEFTDPNPFKLFHIGHLYSNTVGESLARLYESQGWNVARVCYQGDVGMHVAKTLWGMFEAFEADDVSIDTVGELSLRARIAFMGEAYVAGNKAYEDNVHKTRVEALNMLAYAASQRFLQENQQAQISIDFSQFTADNDTCYDPDSVYEVWTLGRSWSLEYFETIYKRLGTKFGHYYFESETAQKGYAIVQEFLQQGVFEEGEGGAVIFKGEKHGLHTRVFINGRGLPTYEAKDMGLPWLKRRDFDYDKSIILTGNEQDEYFDVILAALRVVDPTYGERTMHLSHGMVRLPEGKMGSREGNVIAGDALLDIVHERVLNVMQSSERIKVEEARREEIAEQVSIGAVKYALLKSSIGGDIVFDMEQSVSFEGNSGPYIQYTHARAQSILRQAAQGGIDTDEVSGQLAADALLNDDERVLALQISRFSDAVAEAAAQHAPHTLCAYLHELAQQYNGFYTRNRVLQADTNDEQTLRLLLTRTVAHTLRNGLAILGIPVPERM